jgi:N-acetylglucosaminyl-diphospho-decaprenol L-rhamnosyltransferase
VSRPEPVSPDLAVVVVNYGSSGLLARNLVHVTAELPDATIVVVDCWSSPEERRAVDRVCAKQHWQLVALADNRGFGGGMNAGVAAALESGVDDLLLLNPDAVITAPAVASLRAAVRSHRLRLVAPVILDDTGAVWFRGVDLDLADGSMHRADLDAPSEPGRRRWLTGACLLVTRELWTATGGFDESYFLYWEDVDFSQRVVEAGGELLVVANATAVHQEGGTQHRPDARAKSSDYYYFNIRNRMRYAAAHLEDADVRRWQRTQLRAAYAVLLRGGRRQFLRPWAPLSAALRGVRDGRRVVRQRGARPGR